MWMSYVFAGMTLVAVGLATFLNQTRQAILSLWVAGLSLGALYLTIGAEFLAIIQWIVSTLVTLSFIFFAVMFGEFSSTPTPVKQKMSLMTFLSLILGLVFTLVIGLGTRSFTDQTARSTQSLTDLSQLGKILTQEHLLSLEVLGLILFLVLVGGGVVSRFEGDDQE